MIEHVYRRCRLSDALDEVFVATCDASIAEAIHAVGGQVIMTSAECATATDRVAEAASKVDADVIVMIQGDEPLTPPEVIADLLKPMEEDPGLPCVNLMRLIETEEEFLDRNCVKVCVDRDDYCLFMTREPIPSPVRSGFGNFPAYRQLVLVPFRRELLLEFATWTPTPLETAESIDMLRILENGRRIKMVRTTHLLHAVDCPEDMVLVEELMRSDPVYHSYAEA